eukprot:600374-Amphidinium_carterae.1
MEVSKVKKQIVLSSMEMLSESDARWIKQHKTDRIISSRWLDVLKSFDEDHDNGLPEKCGVPKHLDEVG